MAGISRRGLLGKVAIVGGSFLLAGSDESVTAALALPASAGNGQKDPLPVHTYEVKPLPFEADDLHGISQGAIVSHHSNDYSEAVKRLNSVQENLSRLPHNAPDYIHGLLMREKLAATNSMFLHELYFANLGGDGRLTGAIQQAMVESFGTTKAWERNFRAVARSLTSGSGWVILAYSPYDQRLHNIASADHAANLAGGQPLLVMDMYEHSYQHDYGNDVKQYIHAFFKNINWSVVNKRFKEMA